jgi:hypothetical protein
METIKLIYANNAVITNETLPKGINKFTSAINTILSTTKSKKEVIGNRKLKAKRTLLIS